jgi:hypothetical protein
MHLLDLFWITRLRCIYFSTVDRTARNCSRRALSRDRGKQYVLYKALTMQTACMVMSVSGLNYQGGLLC